MAKSTIRTRPRYGGILGISLLCVMATRSTTARAEEPGDLAQETDRTPGPSAVVLGLGARFMPAGWYDIGVDSARAYPALGFSIFAEHALSRFFSIGVFGEGTFNIVSNVPMTPVGTLFGAGLRVVGTYPVGKSLIPFLAICPGYSYISLAHYHEGADGFVLTGDLGLRFRITSRHSLFGELGYMRGFQKMNERPWAPSYVVTALGWQVSL